MKRLSTHILSLLRLYDSVALPGVGFFSLRYLPAYIDRELSSFIPPRFLLLFTRDSEAESPLLAKSYMRKEGISSKAARKLVELDIEKFLEALKESGEVSLPGIGVFSENEGNIRFKQDFCLNPPLPPVSLYPSYEEELEEEQDSNLAENLEEASETTVPELNPVEETETEVEEPAVEPVLQEPEIEVPVMEEPVMEEPVRVQPEVREHFRHANPDYYYLPIHKKLAKVAACIMLVIIVGLATFLPIGRPQSAPSTAAITPISSVDPTPVEPQEPEEIIFEEDSVEEVIPGATSLETKPYLTVGQDTIARYHTVVAAFKSEKEAEKFIDSHDGNKSRFNVLKKGTFYLITVSSSNDMADLETGMPLVRSDYPDAWILSLN